MLAIRNAEKKDIPQVLNLLSQVLEIHAVLRPDLFVSGTTKYTGEDLEAIFQDQNRPVFIAEDEEGQVAGYCFCIMQRVENNSNMLWDSLSMYIDDICVDEQFRRRHVGRALCEHAVAYARRQGCYDVTLNVWEGNDTAREFYHRMGFDVRKTVMEKLL